MDNIEKIITYWNRLEDTEDIVVMKLICNIMIEGILIKIITIHNSNSQRYLEVLFHNDLKDIQSQYTHIQSFINDMISLNGNKCFEDMTILDYNNKRKAECCCDNDIYKKRKIFP
jgi:hypothetical protein